MRGEVLVVERKDGWRVVKRRVFVAGFLGTGQLKVKYSKEGRSAVVCKSGGEGFVRFMPPLVFERGTLYKVIGEGDIRMSLQELLEEQRKGGRGNVEGRQR